MAESILFIEGMIKIANVIIALVAGFIAISMINKSWQLKILKAWRILIVVLILFVIQEILGALRAFQIFSSVYLTHIIPTFMLCFFIWAILVQLSIIKKDAQ